MRLLRLVCNCTHTVECGDDDKVRDTAAASEGWQCQDEKRVRNRPPLYRLCTLPVQLLKFEPLEVEVSKDEKL